MKVNELFEAVQGSPGQGGKLRSGAYYKPMYRSDIGQLRGSVKDWLEAMKITPQDIEKALARVKEMPLFRNDLPKAGLRYEPTPGKEKNGTLTFVVDRPRFFIHDTGNGKAVGGAKSEEDLEKTRPTKYNIYANGQIRWAAPRTYGDGDHTTPLKSPKPRVIAGDPVGTLVSIYKAAIEEMLAKWKKTQERHVREKEQAKKLLGKVGE